MGVRTRLTRDQRRDLIERAAEEVFAERGYHGASMGQIAAAAGISKPVIYDHFSSKRDLHVKLLEKTRDRLFEIQIEGMAGETWEERFRSALEAYFEYVELHPYASRMLFRETTGEPEVVAAHRAVLAEADRRIAAVLRAEGVENPEMAAVLVRNAVDGLSAWWSDHPEQPREQVMATAVDLVWRGLAR